MLGKKCSCQSSFLVVTFFRINKKRKAETNEE